ncbi:uncharacterized protein LOC108109938 [Drosophila eugracilis]|uniref:uncharacterized protein LOC108109938 n=1 Tax=Drosophila eugracilis TaxID=29029 RepID=UPI0007E78387|nr:uncharacterized protein LOC108109938 [Drosophila eugracilis]
MNKSQKPTKVKRGKRHSRSRTQPQDLVESEVENARKAVERKLIYLSESNRGNAPSCPGKQIRGGKKVSGETVNGSSEGNAEGGKKAGSGGAGSGGAGGGGAGKADASDGGTAGHGGHRRKHTKKQPALAPVKEMVFDEEETLQEKVYKFENRMRGGYNIYLESPRRNGLTPRDYEAEAAEIAALTAAQRTPSGTMKKGFLTMDGKEIVEEDFGRLQLKPLSSYAQNHHHMPSYSCGICGAKFHIRSLLGAHRRTHDDDFKVRFRGRRTKRESSTTLTAANLCKFCDRKFDLERTLHIHLLSYCKKIPPQQRRKLAYTELAHEKKAPLPSFQRAQNSHRNQGTISTKNTLTQQQQLHKTIIQASASQERWR